MRNNEKRLKIKKDILNWCLEDYTDLLNISDFVNTYLKEKSINIIKKNTLQILKNLLEEGLIVAGTLKGNNIFRVWDKEITEIILEIKNKWDNLDRELMPEEIVWFDITEKGKKEFEYLNSLPELRETDPFYFDDE